MMVFHVVKSPGKFTVLVLSYHCAAPLRCEVCSTAKPPHQPGLCLPSGPGLCGESAAECCHFTLQTFATFKVPGAGAQGTDGAPQGADILWGAGQ